MSNFFGLGHSRGRSSSSSSHLYQPQLDFASSFDAPSDDEDDDQTTVRRSTNTGGYDTTFVSMSTTQNDTEEGSATPLTNSSLPSTSTLPRTTSTESTTIPGGYDFEPQAYEGGGGGAGLSSAAPPPTIRSSTRPGINYDNSRIDSTSFRGLAQYGHLYGSHRDEVGGGGGDTQARSEGGAGLLNWRGIAARLGVGITSRTGNDRTDDGGAESNRLLFSQDESDETDSEQRPGGSAYPPRNIHLPLPSRPPQFAPPPVEAIPSTSRTASPSIPTGGGAAGGRVYGGGQGNDGVFANLAAKPDGATNSDFVGEGPDKDEVLPAYEAAALDSTPPYWETTVITPGGFLGPDDICVDGMPVGNLFSFMWNLLVSMSFQFVGFLLTYLLHTTHAAKNGSRAGLGITLIQLGFYLKQHTDHSGDPLYNDGTPGDQTGLNGGAGPSSMMNTDPVRWSWWGGPIDDIPDPATPTATLSAALGNLPTQIANGLAGALDASDPDATATGIPKLMGEGGMSEAELNSMSIATNEWMSFVLVTVGSFLLIGGCLSYWRAVRYARAMRQGQGPGADSENMVAVS